MSCQACEIAQEEKIHTFIRIKSGNVMISGCHKHLGELIFKVRRDDVQQKQEELKRSYD